MYFRWYFNLMVVFILFACHPNDDKMDKNLQGSFKYPVQYAQHFRIFKNGSAMVIGITENFKDTIYFEVKQSYNRLAVLGTIPVFQLSLLNATDKIVAIDDIKYYNLNSVIERKLSNKIAEVLPNLQWNYELLLSVNPDVIITYSNIDENMKLKELIHYHSVQHLLYLDYLEQHPLGRAEWIKVLGCLTGKDSLANQIFSDIEKKYWQLTKYTDTTKFRPKVLTEVMYGDVWYIAGGRSYIAQLIKDAGGQYVFDFHNYENSKPYSLEYVLKYAKEADFWIHTHQFESFESLKNANSKYVLFRAFQNKNCFNNNTIKNKFGFNDYYESGICMPYLILEDLINIFHPDYLSSKTVHYYYRLSEK